MPTQLTNCLIEAFWVFFQMKRDTVLGRKGNMKGGIISLEVSPETQFVFQQKYSFAIIVLWASFRKILDAKEP